MPKPVTRMAAWHCLTLGRVMQFAPFISVKTDFLEDKFQICLWFTKGANTGLTQYLSLPGPSWLLPVFWINWGL